MKEIKAFIQTTKVSAVALNLQKNEFSFFTYFKGNGPGKYADPKSEFPSLKHPYLLSKITKLELICDKKYEAQTGLSGDGLMYLVDASFKMRIRE